MREGRVKILAGAVAAASSCVVVVVVLVVSVVVDVAIPAGADA